MKLLLLGICLLPLLVGMGIWQLQRAEHKQQALDAVAETLRSQPLEWEQLNAGADRYRKAQLEGSYLQNADWLVDNQTFRGRFGYRVVTPFCLGQRCMLVDRGWIAGNLNRDILPEINTPEGLLRLSGSLDLPMQNPLDIGNEPVNTSPFRVQELITEEIAQKHQIALSPWIMRLDQDQAGHYQVVWQPVVVGPEKHWGYAVQWFAMAVTLVILLVYVYRRQLKNIFKSRIVDSIRWKI